MEDARKILAYGALPALSAVGFYGSMYLGYENGLVKSLSDIVRGKTDVLPNTSAKIIKKWTGIKPLDDYLAFYLAFFVPTLGKGNPSTQVQNRFFIGQFAALWTLIQLQAQKSSNSSIIQSRLNLALTAFGVQTVGAATLVPLFCAVQVATSVLGKHGGAGVLSEARTAAIPASTLLTILIPLGLASFLKSQPQKQAWVNVFQVFYIFAELIERTAGPALLPASSTGILPASLDRVYSFATGLSVLSHVGTIAIILLTKIAPKLFPAGFAEHVSFKRVFLPRINLETHGDLFEARIHFLRWDAAICLSSFLLWSAYTYLTVLPSSAVTFETVAKLGAQTLVRVLLTGPIGAAAYLLKQRDIMAAL